MFDVPFPMRILPTLFALTSSVLFCSSATGQLAFSEEILLSPLNNRAVLEELVPINEVSVYSPEIKQGVTVLENGYASYTFKNDDWPPQGDSVIAKEVNIIFTKYPKDKEFWLTDYHWLLAKRLRALFKLDPRLNREDIDFRITLQTSCDNEMEAMQLFHGIEVYYNMYDDAESQTVEVPSRSFVSTDNEEHTVDQDAVHSIKKFMVQERYLMDSVVFNLFDHHPEWKKTAVVMDWTRSMYGHGAEVMLWHALHEPSSGIEHVVMFNDGGDKPIHKKPLGKAGGIYFAEASPIDKPIKLFRKVQRKGRGGDSPENDLEAIMKTIESYSDIESITLIADNRSCIRDYSLIGCIDKPINVVLIDTRKGLNHQYINLAYKTGGGLFWEGNEINDIERLIQEGQLIIDDTEFMLREDGLIIPKDRYDDRFGPCTQYYYAPNRRRAKNRAQEPDCYFTD